MKRASGGSEAVQGVAEPLEPLLREIEPASMLGAQHSHDRGGAPFLRQPQRSADDIA